MLTHNLFEYTLNSDIYMFRHVYLEVVACEEEFNIR